MLPPGAGPKARAATAFGSHAEDMSAHTIPSGAVVVGVDGSPSALQALDWAARQAEREHRPLVLLHAYRALDTQANLWLVRAGADVAEVVGQVEDEARALVEGAAGLVRESHPELGVTTFLRAADPRQALLDAADRASLIVIGSRGRGPVRTLLLGSTSVAVASHATCPVVVVRPHHPGEVRRGVLVGVDGTDRCRATLEFAYRQAALHDLPLTVLHTFWDAATLVPADGPRLTGEHEADRLLLAESVSGMGEEYPEVRVQLQLAPGLPDAALLRASARMNLVVVGRHPGRGLARGTFGGIARSVVEHAPTIVAVVPD